MTKLSTSRGRRSLASAVGRVEIESKSQIRDYRRKKEEYWQKEGARLALELFHDAARRVPAYADFLKKNKVRSNSVRTITDFQKVPETNKENYIRAYRPAERTFDGNFSAHSIIAASSGTSGAATLWPRGNEQELIAARTHLTLFKELYEIDALKSLVVIGFPMGIYVSGVATALPSFLLSLAHPNVTVLTAGNNKESILSVLPDVSRHYDQIILCGHPFFIKEVLEDGKERGIDWSSPKVRTFFCSEGFTEEWRTYVSDLIPGSIPVRDVLSTYGSTELLLMGYETPQTIAIRRQFEKQSQLSNKIFSSQSPPSLFQYDPRLRYIEGSDGELLFTSKGTMPLIRYNLHDSGTVTSISALTKALGKQTVASSWKPWTLPVIALHGRSDMTLVFNAVNIYPEQIHHVLNHTQFLSSFTGRFKLEKQYHEGMKTRFAVHVEMRHDAPQTAELKTTLEREIVQVLLSQNLEYRDASSKLGANAMHPHVELHTYADPRFFPAGVKPRYIVSS